MNILAEILNFLQYQRHRIKRTPRFLCTKRLVAYLKNTPPPFVTEHERIKMIKFLRWHLVGVFNYPFAAKYRFKKGKVYMDSNNGLPFVITKEGNRLYFKRCKTRKQVSDCYMGLCMEQDKHSPHYYCFNSPKIDSSTILADVGAAEASFSLKFIDIVKKIYIFESDSEWIEALEATFQPWKDKVEIVNKYVYNNEVKNIEKENDAISLDNFFENSEPPTIIKIDVEGAEMQVLAGANKMLANKRVTDLLVCTYHHSGDEDNLTRILTKNGYTVNPSEGYMLFEHSPPFGLEIPIDFRRGVIHAKK